MQRRRSKITIDNPWFSAMLATPRKENQRIVDDLKKINEDALRERASLPKVAKGLRQNPNIGARLAQTNFKLKFYATQSLWSKNCNIINNNKLNNRFESPKRRNTLTNTGEFNDETKEILNECNDRKLRHCIVYMDDKEYNKIFN